MCLDEMETTSLGGEEQAWTCLHETRKDFLASVFANSGDGVVTLCLVELKKVGFGKHAATVRLLAYMRMVIGVVGLELC